MAKRARYRRPVKKTRASSYRTPKRRTVRRARTSSRGSQTVRIILEAPPQAGMSQLPTHLPTIPGTQVTMGKRSRF